jgi:NAD+ diphosphatase
VSEAPLGRLALARAATDRAAEHRKDDAWLAAAWADPGTRVLRIADGRTLVDDGRIVTSGPFATDRERYFLGVDDDGVAWFAVREDGPLRAPLGSAAVPQGLREVGPVLDDRDAGLLVLAAALGNWHTTHQHCPRCGARTTITQGGFVRVCPADGSEHYPRTDPAMIVLVTDASGERALLGHGAAWPPGRFSTLAGFVEPGESAEMAVVREVAEEVRIRVGHVTYLGSQPWPFPSSLMLGFRAQALDDGAEPVPDGVEVTEARWFSRAELHAAASAGEVLLPPPVSIARRLVEHWYGGPVVEEETRRW